MTRPTSSVFSSAARRIVGIFATEFAKFGFYVLKGTTNYQKLQTNTENKGDLKIFTSTAVRITQNGGSESNPFT